MTAYLANSAESRDVRYHLHPYTNLRQLERDGPLVVVRGEGVRVFDNQGKGYIEGMAGLWCAALGFSEDRLVEAATRQLKRLPYYHSFTGRVPEPVVDLAEALIEMAPAPMAKALFSNSGSEANDTAMKVAWYYNNALGRPQKKKILARRGGYHGVTVAAGSLTGLAYAQNGFDLPIDRVVHLSRPHYWREHAEGESEAAFTERLARDLEETIAREGADTIAAFIAEPVMGAGGVILPPDGYFQAIQPILRRHDILFIADEVICGFGRTGSMFGSQTYGIEPDLMTMAKALSSAYLPISALLVSDRVYQALADAGSAYGNFGHGFTYGGHPVAAAVALEAIRIYRERDIVGHVRTVAPALQDGLSRRLEGHPMVGQVRGIGLIAAVELSPDPASRASFDPKATIAARVVKRAEERGAILRAMPSDVVAFSPPLIIDEATIGEMLDIFAASLDDVLHQLRVEGLMPN